MRQPARAAAGPRGGAHDHAVRPPRHRAARRPRSRSSCVDGVFTQPPRRDPRRRQQGGGRGAARGRAALSPQAALRWRCELLFTDERGERAARGAAPSTARALEADFGYVFDHASPIGELIVARADLLPGDRRLHGAAPPTPASGRRQGRSAIVAAAKAIEAMQLGRLDERDDGERRPDRGRHGDERRRRRAAASRPRCEASTTTKATRGRRRDGRRAHLGGEQHRDRRRHRRSRSSSARTGSRSPIPAWSPPRPRCATAASSPCYTATGGGSDANAFEAKGLSLPERRQRHRGATTRRTSASAVGRSRRCST